MKIYICVYRHPLPKIKKIKKANDTLIKKYLEEYPESFYDWGDDPSFFISKETKCPVTWGVCRYYVRKNLRKDDIIVFFCAKQDGRKPLIWRYYYTGYGICKEALVDRDEIWQNNRKYPFNKCFNVLINKKGQWNEYLGEHKDWRKRITAPYIIFDEKQSRFKLKEPLYVAIYFGRKRTVEKWIKNRKANKLRKLIFEDTHADRTLRSTAPRNQHQQINLLKKFRGTEKEKEKYFKTFEKKIRKLT